MKKVLRSFKPLAFLVIRSAFPRIQRSRPKSRFVRARFDRTACALICTGPFFLIGFGLIWSDFGWIWIWLTVVPHPLRLFIISCLSPSPVAVRSTRWPRAAPAICNLQSEICDWAVLSRPSGRAQRRGEGGLTSPNRNPSTLRSTAATEDGHAAFGWFPVLSIGFPEFMSFGSAPPRLGFRVRGSAFRIPHVGGSRLSSPFLSF
jgi:hypothetical protein